MTKFKCLLSGNVFEFHTDFDIETMRKHPQYVEIEDGLQTEEKQKHQRKSKETTKRKNKGEVL